MTNKEARYEKVLRDIASAPNSVPAEYGRHVAQQVLAEFDGAVTYIQAAKPAKHTRKGKRGAGCS